MIYESNVFKNIFPISFLLLVLFNCSNKEDISISKTKSDIAIYKDGLTLLENEKFEKAADEFNKLNLNHPYSSIAPNAEIMTAFSYYQNNEINKAIIKLETFTEMNPTGKLASYAQYLLAMCYYIQLSNQGRDPSLSMKALKNFQKVVTKFPKSKYAKDAKLKIQYIRNNLARNELLVGVFYLKNYSPSSSIKRFKSIIQNYQNTEVIPETLYRLSESLLMVGLKEEAVKSNAVLKHNFPNNEWTMLSEKLINLDSKNPETEGLTTSIKNYLKTIFD